MESITEVSIDADLKVTTELGSVFIEKSQYGKLVLKISTRVLFRECIRKYQVASIQKLISTIKTKSKSLSIFEIVSVSVKGRKIITYGKQQTSYSNIIYLGIQYLLAKLNF